MEEKTKPRQFNVAWLIGAGVLAWWFWGGGWERTADSGMKKIEQKVAADAVEQYRMTQRSGSAMDVCVQAGMVSAAYLQAKDQASYDQWKKTEAADCKRAGLPR